MLDEFVVGVDVELLVVCHVWRRGLGWVELRLVWKGEVQGRLGGVMMIINKARKQISPDY